MKLSEWRLKRGLTQKGVATGIKINQSQVARYESGQSIPSPPVMARLRTFTNDEVTANDFYPDAPSVIREAQRKFA